MKKVLVTGVGGPAGRSVADLLKQRAFDVVGVDMQTQAVEGMEFFVVPPADAPDFLDAMHDLVERIQPALVIPTVTEELPILASGWHEVSRYPILLSPLEGIVAANDKHLTSRALVEKGVSVPRFCLPSEVTSAEELKARIGWPCISKPRVGRGGRGVAVRIETDFPAVKDLPDDHILQEFASGTDYAPNVYIDTRGRATVVVLEKTELREGLVGNAKSVQRVEAADVAELGIQAAVALGLSGPVDVDIRRRTDGIPVVLEVNARFGANILHAQDIFNAMVTDHLG